ncbi:AzlC family ABC transporter permease [Cryobacterium sp. 10S3]|uniref:AzlC family ABC transporter permease n=1 Tax=unclassified Cryobacterium TaxID=2649013 RepID=UPI002AC89CAD|nr:MULTISPECIES: AzlC family ABC transporter permease [unclassified Cryobacterium]MEB0200614.1 AzlC family ABC transporter permease [Cryobacterium sp. 5I3]MEB0287314.1 AzlC family ABC transporter permease [Cryobacterium sp. 10S3]WPX15057.1 AzlC family ABC transporter permease [Cryobacterium sp. 10S3]
MPAQLPPEDDAAEDDAVDDDAAVDDTSKDDTAEDAASQEIAARALDRVATREGIAVGVATAAYGFSFGALSVASGLTLWQTAFLSLVMFSGGSQFALIGVLAAGGVAAGPSAIAGAALLGTRNGLYGIRTAPIVGRGWLRRFAAAWITIDESTAVALAQPTPRSSRRGFWVTGLIVFAGWNLTTFVGALIGNTLGDTRAYGLDAAAAAAFVGLLWPRLKRRQALVVAVAAFVVATALTPVLAPGLPVLAAALVAIVVGWSNWAGARSGTPSGTPTRGSGR